MVLTISKLSVGESLRVQGGAKTKKHVVHFAEMDGRPDAERKRWVLNKTNAKTIAKLYGTETDNWTGKRITLFPTTCEMKGETVDCIRVRAEVPRPRRPAPQQPAAPAQAARAPPDQGPTVSAGVLARSAGEPGGQACSTRGAGSDRFRGSPMARSPSRRWTSSG